MPISVNPGSLNHSPYKADTEDLLFVVALLFYVHGKHLRSCRDGQLT